MAEVDERRALGLYVVAARDFTDFIDMLREPGTSDEAVEFLRQMCATPNPEMSADDAELNSLILPFVVREQERRRVS